MGFGHGVSFNSVCEADNALVYVFVEVEISFKIKKFFAFDAEFLTAVPPAMLCFLHFRREVRLNLRIWLVRLYQEIYVDYTVFPLALMAPFQVDSCFPDNICWFFG